MRLNVLSIILVVVSIVVGMQSRSFTLNTLDYIIDLPSVSWQAVTRVDLHKHVEFVNGNDRSEGYLRIRKKLVSRETTTADLFREAESWELQRLPGYVVCSNGAGSEFSGNLKGSVFSYEFVNQGRNMDGRIYYLRVDNRTFYVLHFTMASDRLQSLRAQMDSIARSFRMK